MSRVAIRGLFSALPDFALAAGFLITWVQPFKLGSSAIEYHTLTMMLEFVTIHSAGFMGVVAFSRAPGSRRARNIFLLGLFYTLFVGAFALAFGTWWPLIAFWLLTLNRMLAPLLEEKPSGAERVFIQAGWALSAVYYLGGAFLTALLPVPEFGLTSAVRDMANLSGSGLWIDEPQRVMAFGVFYFGLTGIGEMLGFARVAKFAQNVRTEST